MSMKNLYFKSSKRDFFNMLENKKAAQSKLQKKARAIEYFKLRDRLHLLKSKKMCRFRKFSTRQKMTIVAFLQISYR